ncbi:hypothetical protein DAA61_36690 [Bradyrhizobium sp. WBAH33]|nr:hypothetical protein [Bradyrhizobium sp. WBAH33]QCK00792.1 hypothetical protein DAA61_36690 [Bradyrhizobium sp. WBAH33]QCK08159.1 hypothetical protein DAB18_36735 [Bradyrhizobium sp. WBAH41]
MMGPAQLIYRNGLLGPRGMVGWELAMGMDYMAEAARHRHVAEEYRTIALCKSDEGLRGIYLRLADDYDLLAANEDRIASNRKLVN